MIMTIYTSLSGWSCVGAETAQMIHELLSTTVATSVLFFSSSKSLYPFSFIQNTNNRPIFWFVGGRTR